MKYIPNDLIKLLDENLEPTGDIVKVTTDEEEGVDLTVELAIKLALRHNSFVNQQTRTPDFNKVFRAHEIYKDGLNVVDGYVEVRDNDYNLIKEAIETHTGILALGVRVAHLIKLIRNPLDKPETNEQDTSSEA